MTGLMIVTDSLTVAGTALLVRIVALVVLVSPLILALSVPGQWCYQMRRKASPFRAEMQGATASGQSGVCCC